jgi:acyl-CoA synthetase (AMP-forming)/AMP-acid ligase II
MFTHRQVETMYACFHSHLGFSEGDRHLLVAPMTHAAGVIGMLFFPIGGTNYIMTKADPLAIMEAIEKHRITHLFLPPTVILMMLAEPAVKDYDYSSLKHFMFGAAPMPTSKLLEAVEVFGPVMTEIFGQVEAPCTITIKHPRDYIDEDGSINMPRARSAGRPSMFTQVAILDDDDKEVSSGERGEICARGNLVMPGYYKNPEASETTLQNGWLHTGDIGVQDEDGFITIVDRKKDMIISGGFNVYPNEVEQVLNQHPAVQDCAVIGVPDDKWGESVKGVVQLKPGETANAEELILFCKEKLGGVKAPKTIDIIEDLPRSPNGKVLKRELRKTYWEGRENSIV